MRKNKAVTEIIGTVVLLGMAIALFSIVQSFAFFLPDNPTTPSAQIVGTIYHDTSAGQDFILIEHHRGESLSLDSEIIFRIDGTDVNKPAGSITMLSSNGNDKWDIGETIKYDPNTDFSITVFTDENVEVLVIDPRSDSIILMATLQ